MTEPATTIDLVRHAEVLTPGLFCAPPDEPLSDKGQIQFDALNADIRWDQIISSPQTRCRIPAEKLATLQHTPIRIMSQWQEMNFGLWIGKPHQQVWKTNREQLMQLWSKPLEFTAPDGDRMRDFIIRVQAAWASLLEEYRGQNILLITHAGVIRTVLAIALEIDYQSAQKFSVAHAKINRIRCYPDGEISLLNWACSPHTLP